MYSNPQAYNISKPYQFSMPSFLGGVLVGAGAVIGIAAIAGASTYPNNSLENRVRNSK